MVKDLPLIHDLTREEIRLALMLKALGNPVRFRIMQYLAENQLCITAIHRQPASQGASGGRLNPGRN
jgi:hypothetical protein